MIPGDIIAGRFAIVSKAGVGGMGVVFRARDLETGDDVAVKVPWVGSDEENTALQREAELLSRLSHPGVVGYRTHGMTTEGQAFLVTEWVDGVDLKQLQAREPLRMRGVLKLALRLLEALGAVHAVGIVHRDVKPANVLVREGEPLTISLTDFGVAVPVGELEGIGVMVGTPAYMAPEQALGDPGVDARADVFSVGCVLFSCLTGRPPFVGEDSVAVLAKLLLDEAPRLHQIRPDAPGWIDEYLALLLAKDPRDRPADAAIARAELIQRMHDARAGVGTTPMHGINLDELPEGPDSAPTPELAASVPFASAQPFPSAQPVAAISNSSVAREVSSPFASLQPGATPPGLRRDPAAEAALTGHEQRVVSVLIGRRTRVGGMQAPLARREDLTPIATRFGARLELLADGSIVGSVSHLRDVTELSLASARCALALLETFSGYRIGLATGLATLEGPMPVGQVIDRVAELLDEPAENGDGVFVDATTEGLIRRHMEVDTNVTPARLRGERTLPRDGVITTTDTARPMLGRQDELARLLERASSAFSRKECHVVLLSGEPGIGKSRLRDEVISALTSASTRPVIWSAAGDPARASALSVVAGLIRSAAGIGPFSSQAAVRARLDLWARRALGAEDGAAAAEHLASLVVPSRSNVLPQPVSVASAVAALPAAQLRGDRLRDAWDRVLTAQIARHPLVISLDDLQWADIASLSFLAGSLRRAEGPLLVLGLVRRDALARIVETWRSLSPVSLTLDPLDEATCNALIDQLFHQPLKKGRRADLIRRSEGNPFFLEELLHARAHGRGESPGSLLAVLQSRLATLPSRDRRVLRAASVLGAVAEMAAVQTLLGETNGLDDSAERLADAGVVDLHVVVPEVTSAVALTDDGDQITPDLGPRIERIAFRSSLLRDAVYGTLTDHDRALGHRLAGAWHEAHESGDPLTLAEHFELGGQPKRAIGWLIHAADQALQGGDLAGVIELVARAVRCGADELQLGLLRLQEAEARSWRGEFPECERLARDAMALLPADSDGWFQAAGELAMSGGKLGHLSELTPVADTVIEASLRRPCTSALVAVARLVSPLTFAKAPSVPRLRSTLETLAQTLGPEDPTVAGWHHRVLAFLAMTEDDAEAWADHERMSADSFARAFDPRNACWQRLNAGYVLLTLGDNEQAEGALRETLRVAERLGLSNLASTARQNLGLALLRLDRLDEARELEETSIDECRAQGDRAMESSAHSYLAEVLLRAGDLEGAKQHAELGLALGSEFPPWKLSALIVTARAALEENKLDVARVAVDEALAIVESPGGADENEPSARLALVEVLIACGEKDEAARRITEARTRIEERAAKILDPARRARFLTGVPDVRRTLALVAQRRSSSPDLG